MSLASAARVSSLGPPEAHPLLKPEIAAAREHLLHLAEIERTAFLERLARWWPELSASWGAVYGTHPEGLAALRRLVTLLADRYAGRRSDLRAVDLDRVARPDWFQDPSMIGYVCYPDRFGGSLRGVADHLDYLAELRIRYLHLMPLLKMREGDADGGYAVADYRAVDPRFGTMDDLEALCDDLRARDMSLCVDLVLNHTAAEASWAVAARAGDVAASAMYRIYPDRTMPDRFELTLPETFPEMAPGNFTQLEDGRWVWTTFNAFQWDLDWSNPAVFIEMTDVLLNLANRGVDVFRLDAVAFMWKRLGTNSQNQPEVHDLLQALRTCARIAAPAVIFKAEAIVGPDDLMAYLGIGRYHGRVSDMAYHNSLMVQFWSALATGDTRLMFHVLRDLPRKPSTTAWATYIRNHDDIGWAITEKDADSVGWTGPAHRSFLSAFYSGAFSGSFARGERFNYVPSTGDSRISGTFASLAGVQAALEAGDPDPEALRAAVARMRLGHALIMAWDGIPLIYMGDEIGLCNDATYLVDPDREADNRWLHRPTMDWQAAQRRHDATSIEGRIFGDLQHLIEVRRATPQFHAAMALDLIDTGDPTLFAFSRSHSTGAVLAVWNFGQASAVLDCDVVSTTIGGALRDLLDGTVWTAGAAIEVPALGVRWLVGADQP